MYNTQFEYSKYFDKKKECEIKKFDAIKMLVRAARALEFRSEKRCSI